MSTGTAKKEDCIIETRPDRVFVVGDIHGCRKEVELLYRHLVDVEGLSQADRLIFLGDYVDRGPDSKGVIDLMLDIEVAFPNTVFLKGNHEDMLLGFLGYEGQGAHFYLPNGGVETLESYGIHSREELEDALNIIPQSHQEFLTDLDRIVLLDRYVIVHAGVNPLRDLKSQIDEDIYWIRDEFIQNVHYFDKTIVFGHTPYQNVFFDQPYKIGVDTGLVYGNMLSCIELGGGSVYQVAKDDTRVQVSAFVDLGGEVTGFSWGGGTQLASGAIFSDASKSNDEETTDE